MPKTAYGNAVAEVPGQYDADIQQYIIANTQENAGWIPGSSPYSPSAPSVVQTTQGAKDVPTARCANGDVACLSGVGSGGQQNAPLTLEQQKAIGQVFGQASTDYQRAAALATATGNAPLVLSFEITAGIAGLLEQMFNPSAGKIVVDTAVDIAVESFSERTGIPMALVNEIAECEIKPRLQTIKDRL
jgi:hypothetical protein